jgi:hypothetical protein
MRTFTACGAATEPEVRPLTAKSFPSHNRKRDDNDQTQAGDRRRDALLETTMNSPPAKHAELSIPKKMESCSSVSTQERGVAGFTKHQDTSLLVERALAYLITFSANLQTQPRSIRKCPASPLPSDRNPTLSTTSTKERSTQDTDLLHPTTPTAS